MKRGMRLSVVLAMLVTAMLSGTTAAGAASDTAAEARAEHQRIVDFWTPERVAQAIPRDFVYDSSTGRFRPFAPPPGKGPKPVEPPTFIAREWEGGGTAQRTTGKVLFQSGRNYYVCSAALVTETDTNRSIALTAAHCVFDESGRDNRRTPEDERFATNWMFIPDYDSMPAPLTANGSFCGSTAHGCWTAESLVVHQGYATAGGFNTQATLHDFAFAVLRPGGHEGKQADWLGAQTIDFTAVGNGTTVHAFGYPAADPFDGTKLWYCADGVGRDPNNGNATYRLTCDMTGGSSGGPWMAPFGDGSGTLMSVNSYGYNGIDAMHGPVFTTDTKDLFGAALTTTANTIVP